MAITIEINGVDRSNQIEWRSVKWDQVLTNQIDSLSFTMNAYGSKTFKPSVLDDVELFDNGTRVFSGGIVKIDESIIGVDKMTFNVFVKDQSLFMDRRLVIEVFEDRPVINIICEILNRYINRGSRIEIASFEATENWSGGAVDFDNFRIGDQARILTSTNLVPDTTTRNIYFTLQPTGYDTADFMDIDLFVDVAANLESLTLKLGDEPLTNYFSRDISDQVNDDGWNLSHVLMSSFSTTGAPDWNNIRRIEIEAVGVAGQTVNVTVDNWQVVKKDAFTRFNAQGATQIVEYMSMNYEYPSNIMQRLAELFAWHWYVDEDKDIHFFAKFDKASGFNLTDTNQSYVFKSLKINSNGDQLRNSIFVRGSDFLGPTRTEDLSQYADSSNKILHLGYKYLNPILEINGVRQALGVDNLDGFADNQGSTQILKGGGAVQVGDVTANTYQAMQVVTTKHGRRSAQTIRVRKVGNPVDNFEIQIFSDDGSDKPSGSNLSAISSISGGSLLTDFQDITFNLTESATNSLLFDPNELYHMRAGRSGAVDNVNYYEIDISTTAQYEGYAHSGDNIPVWTQLQLAWFFSETLSYNALHGFNEKIVDFLVAPTGGDLIEFTGDPFFPVFVLYNEGSSINEVGIFQYKIVDKSIKSKKGARQRALQEVLAWSEEIHEASFTTYQSGLRAGQTINIQSNLRNLDDDYIIQKISVSLRGPDRFQYSIKCVTTRTYGILYWLQQQILKDDREIIFDENEIQDKVEAIFETLQFQTQYLTTVYNGKVWGITNPADDLKWNGGVDHIWI